MINEFHANAYCKEDISLIENYELAISDSNEMWVVHHRDEYKVLPSGITVIRTASELKEDGRYYNCPANELIFLTKAEHCRLHMKVKSKDYKGKNNPFYGKHHTDESKSNISKSMKGIHRSDETRKKMSEAAKVRWTRRHAAK